MKRASKVLILLFVGCLPGFSQQALAVDNEEISLSSLPIVVQEVVKREFARMRVTQIDDGEYDGIPVFEIEAETTDGRDLQIEVGKDGTLYQIDEEVRLQNLPPAVLAVFRKEVGNVEPDGLKRLTEHEKVHYEVGAEVSGKDIELNIGADGTILEKEVDGEKVEDVSSPALATTAEPGSDELPLQYLGPYLPDKEAPDGRLMYSPGVQNIQVARANRKYPPPFPAGTENEKGWTYQHHVGMGEWKGKLYGVWDMTHVGEDNPPVRVVYATSDDGFKWTQPKDLYPFNKAYNSRFYFFHSSNGRMLVFASGWYPTDNVAEDRKIRLYVREITSDHKLGIIYTLIKPAQGHPPAYTESKDAGFLQACREVLNNKPLLEQADYGILLGDEKMKWHEGKNWPGGKIPSIGGNLWIFGKSMCFYHRADGVLVGTCKMGWVTQSRDEGETWSFPTIPRGIKGGGGKTWAQATPDDRYTMIYIPQGYHRYPMAITTSDDGITFRDMRVIHGEVPPQRYEGRAKPLGPQYLRGLSEWGSDGSRNEKDCIWMIYSVSKEDIWVSRVPVPIVAEAKKHANDNFDKIATGPRVPEWNTYSLLRAPVSIAAKGRNHYLQLEDRESTDYARAIRTFPVSKTADIRFRVAAAQTDRGRLEIELLGELGSRPVRLTLNDKGRVQAVDGRQPVTGSFAPGLSGTYFNKADFRDPDDEVDVLGNLHQSWGDSKGNDWSARWTGFIEAPYSGAVIFSAEATDGLRLMIGEKVVIDGLLINGDRIGKVTMIKGRKTPITVAFTSAQGKAKLVLSWSWTGHSQSIVPAAALSHKVPPRMEPVNLMAYKANNWLECNIRADCKTGRYTLKINGWEVLKDAGFAEPSSMIYALSFRTGEYRGKPTGRADQDIPNTEDPLEKVTYRIDDVMTGK
ncbi:MAG: PA14 domain-containing protein [Sedimentisphaerales bacterium]